MSPDLVLPVLWDFLHLATVVLWLCAFLAACLSFVPLPCPLVASPNWQRSFAWAVANKVSQAPAGPPKKAAFPVLRSLVAHIVQRGLQRHPPYRVWCHLRILPHLADLDWSSVLSLGPSSSWSQFSRPPPVTTAIAARGLGVRGSFPIPASIWASYVDPALEARIWTARPPGLRALSRPTHVLLDRLRTDAFLLPCDQPDNLTAFLRPKSSAKAAFIADLRPINALSSAPPPKFCLPSLELLGTTLSAHRDLWAVTIDLSNFFWSLRLPPHMVGAFRLRGLCYDSLPFGWDRSPGIAQETLGSVLTTFFRTLAAELDAPPLFSFHYLDDILFLSPCPLHLSRVTQRLTVFLRDLHLLVSPKSSLAPSQTFTWLGKRFDTRSCTITMTDGTFLKLCAIAVRAAYAPLTKKCRLRIAGNVLWGMRPLPGCTLFLRGLYLCPPGPAQWLSNNGLRALCDGIAVATFGWTGYHSVDPPSTRHIFYVDAAFDHRGICQVGLFNPVRGVQIHRAPECITNQQEGEAYAFEYALRVLSYQHPRSVAVVGDNLGVLMAGKALCPRLHSNILTYLCRRIFNRLFWSGMHVRLFWSPSALNPADPPSRFRVEHDDFPTMCRAALSRWRVLLASPGLPVPHGVLAL